MRFAAQYMRQRPATVIAELISALPDISKAKVKGIPLQVIEDPKEVNAFAGCSQKGGAFMGITAPLLLIMARTSEARAFDELYGTAKYAELSNGIATEVRAQKTVAGPPAVSYRSPRRSILASWRAKIFSSMSRWRSSWGTNSRTTTADTPDAPMVRRPAASRRRTWAAYCRAPCPLFNQPNEIEADVQGTWNLLDTGSHRQGGNWTEEGALMALDFFSRLESLGVENVLLGFLLTHPLPQFRLPIVQNAAAQWRNNGGKAPVFPFQLPDRPFDPSREHRRPTAGA